MSRMKDLMALCFKPPTGDGTKPKFMKAEEIVEIFHASPKLAELIKSPPFARLINSFFQVEVSREIFDESFGGDQYPESEEEWESEQSQLNEESPEAPMFEASDEGLGHSLDEGTGKDQHPEAVEEGMGSGHSQLNEGVAKNGCMSGGGIYLNLPDEGKFARVLGGMIHVEPPQNEAHFYLLATDEIEEDQHSLFVVIMLASLLRMKEATHHEQVVADIIDETRRITEIEDIDFYVTYKYCNRQHFFDYDSLDDIHAFHERLQSLNNDNIIDGDNIELVSFIIPLIKEKYDNLIGTERLEKYLNLIFFKESATIWSEINYLNGSEHFREIPMKTVEAIFNLGKGIGTLLAAGVGKDQKSIIGILTSAIGSSFEEGRDTWDAIYGSICAQNISNKWKPHKAVYEHAVQTADKMWSEGDPRPIHKMRDYLIEEHTQNGVKIFKDLAYKTLYEQLKPIAKKHDKFRRGRPRGKSKKK
ncbi:MAG: hypothetical protein ABSH41_21480 [Syntrophobacteraceae bacterium]